MKVISVKLCITHKTLKIELKCLISSKRWESNIISTVLREINKKAREIQFSGNQFFSLVKCLSCNVDRRKCNGNASSSVRLWSHAASKVSYKSYSWRHRSWKRTILSFVIKENLVNRTISFFRPISRHYPYGRHSARLRHLREHAQTSHASRELHGFLFLCMHAVLFTSLKRFAWRPIGPYNS